MAIKTLRVCKSEELPAILDRKMNYIYFLYDKLIIFQGQNMCYDHFAIVPDVPEEPVIGMMYLCYSDGKIRIWNDYQIVEYADIEDESMIDLLKQCGVTYFYAAEQRYLDPRTQLLELPYLNGTFQLTVELANNLKIDKDTVIAYNPVTSQFEISARPQDYDLAFLHPYTAVDTKTVKLNMDAHTLSGEIKISDDYRNIIKTLNGGLYANVDDKVSLEAFKKWLREFANYKEQIAKFITNINDLNEKAEEIISPESISKRILSTLSSELGQLEEALAKYDEISELYDSMEGRCNDYTDEQVANATSEIEYNIEMATNDIYLELGNENYIVTTKPLLDEEDEDYTPGNKFNPYEEEEAGDNISSVASGDYGEVGDPNENDSTAIENSSTVSENSSTVSEPDEEEDGITDNISTISENSSTVSEPEEDTTENSSTVVEEDTTPEETEDIDNSSTTSENASTYVPYDGLEDIEDTLEEW